MPGTHKKSNGLSKKQKTLPKKLQQMILKSKAKRKIKK